MKTTLSTLWIIVMFNMVFADILSFMRPGFLAEIGTGHAGEVQITQEILLAFAIILEIPIAMIFLSRALGYRANRWANTGAGILTAVFVVRGGSPDLHYLFFAAAEVVCILLILWHCWKWRSPEEEASPSEG